MRASIVCATVVAIAAALCLLCPSAVSAAKNRVYEETFETIKNAPGNQEQMVAFYHSSEADHYAKIKVMNKAAKKLRHDKPDFRFRKCDCDLPANKKECNDASFTSGTFLFTSTANEGIEKYTMDVDAKTIARYIKGKSAPYDEANVLQFTDEDEFFERMDKSAQPKPILVKFFEQWCTHCKRAKVPFAQGATALGDRVEFMEVECSKNDDTTSFCTRNGVKSYPTFILFTGEAKIPFNAEVRHVMTFEKFFDTHVPKPKAVNKEKDAAPSKAESKPAAAPAAAAAKEVPLPPIGEFSPPSSASAAAAAAAAPAVDAASAAEIAALKETVKKLESRLSKVEAMLRS